MNKRELIEYVKKSEYENLNHTQAADKLTLEFPEITSAGWRRRIQRAFEWAKSGDFENETTTETNQYEEQPPMSAMKRDGTIMSVEEYCEYYGLPKDFARTAKLVAHTGVPRYNIASRNLEAKDSAVDLFNSFIEEARAGISNSFEWNVQKFTGTGPRLFVPCVFDLHLGKLAWGEETGDDYDIKIAEARFRDAINDLVAKASVNYDKILFIVGNDIFNSDKSFPYSMTTAGTPQHDDLRWQKMFRTGIRLIVEAINKLAMIAPVDVVTVFSNHDHERVFYLGEVISAVFENHPNVMIDNSPKPRKYYQWGCNLLGLAHGHNEKPDLLPLLMAQEAKIEWGSTWYREWLLGHLHHKKQYLTQSSKDYNGVKVTYLTSPSSADAWHGAKGFVGAIKGAEAFIYDGLEGLVATYTHNIKQ